MKTRTFWGAGLALLLGTLLVAGQSAGAPRRGNKRSAVGTWLIRAAVPGQELPIGAVYTFETEGALLAVRSGAGVISGQGQWKRLPNGRYAGTVIYLRVQPNGDFAGTLKTRSEWTLSRDGTRLTGDFVNDYFDVDGNLTNTVAGNGEAARVQVERMPAG